MLSVEDRATLRDEIHRLVHEHMPTIAGSPFGVARIRLMLVSRLRLSWDVVVGNDATDVIVATMSQIVSLKAAFPKIEAVDPDSNGNAQWIYRD